MDIQPPNPGRALAPAPSGPQAASPQRVLYFSYASNLHAGLMARRCPNSVFLGTACLDDCDFFLHENGRAIVTPRPLGTGRRRNPTPIEGLVYEVHLEEMGILDRLLAPGQKQRGSITFRREHRLTGLNDRPIHSIVQTLNIAPTRLMQSAFKPLTPLDVHHARSRCVFYYPMEQFMCQDDGLWPASNTLLVSRAIHEAVADGARYEFYDRRVLPVLGLPKVSELSDHITQRLADLTSISAGAVPFGVASNTPGPSNAASIIMTGRGPSTAHELSLGRTGLSNADGSATSAIDPGPSGPPTAHNDARSQPTPSSALGSVPITPSAQASRLTCPHWHPSICTLHGLPVERPSSCRTPSSVPSQTTAPSAPESPVTCRPWHPSTCTTHSFVKSDNQGTMITTLGPSSAPNTASSTTRHPTAQNNAWSQHIPSTAYTLRSQPPAPRQARPLAPTGIPASAPSTAYLSSGPAPPELAAQSLRRPQPPAPSGRPLESSGNVAPRGKRRRTGKGAGSCSQEGDDVLESIER
ncbi:hypothetical protein QBC39DRAFT_418270 [Podospora conica]|nr:hypothetical protein QBC39DRAFT_418270 [Schizothecium conicum]